MAPLIGLIMLIALTTCFLIKRFSIQGVCGSIGADPFDELSNSRINRVFVLQASLAVVGAMFDSSNETFADENIRPHFLAPKWWAACLRNAPASISRECPSTPSPF
jgi:hypothetical protein